MNPWERDWREEDKPWQRNWSSSPADTAETTASSLGKTAASAVPKGLFNLVGLFGGMNDLGRSAATWAMQKSGMKPDEIDQAMQARQQFDPMARAFDAMPNSKDVQGAVEKVTGKLPLYEPQTRPEKGLDTFIQLGIGMGKPSAATIGKVVAPATAGTEIAGAATKDDPMMRAVGGFLGGAVPAGFNAWQNVPQKVVRQAIGDITPQQIADAKALQQQGKNVGVPLMGPEALPNSGVQQLASDIAASRTGAPIMRQFLESRPDNIRNAVGGLLNQVGPYRTPEAAAGLGAETATDAIKAAEKARTAATSPFYQAARQDVVGPDALEGLSRALRNQKPFFELPEQQSAIAQYQKVLDPKSGMNAIAADNLYKAARGDTEVAGIGASSADKQAAAVLKPLVGDLKYASEINSPNLAQGRALHEQITNDVINPLVAGPVGRMAGYKSGGFDPANTPVVARVVGELGNTAMARPETIRELHTHLNAQDKSAFPAVARSWLESAFDQSTKQVQSGQNVKLGANFNIDVRGTDFQKANFDEVMRGVAQAQGKNPDSLVKGANVLMDTMAATGRVPGIGSQTAGRLGTQAELSRNPVSAASDILSAKPLGMVGRMSESVFNARRNRIVAGWMTDPNSVDVLVKMARLKPDGITARFYLEQLLNANKEASRETAE